MLQRLKLSGVGPSPELELDFGSRLNLLTGDNGVGKSFLLDIAWWALTRRWPAEINTKLSSGLMARPTSDDIASIEFTFTSKAKTESYISKFDRSAQAWTGRAGRPANAGLILYAQIDGSFAIWDPARNYWKKKGNVDFQDRPAAYVFSTRDVWDGLYDDKRGLMCNGLINDWAGWQKEKGRAFESLSAVLKALSPSDSEPIIPGKLTRISLDEPRDIPTLKMAYGQEVPILHASAGMRRIIALAYLLVWAWEEHVQASRLLGQETTSQIIFLVDEIEAHLHPRWQRSIVQALLEVVKKIADNAEVQLLTATHSPLVLASVEPYFDPDKDAWFDFDLVNTSEGTEVILEKRPFRRKGDVNSWLISEAFDMRSARSIQGEKVLEEATAALSSERINTEEAKEIDKKLRTVLGETDEFWIRWRFIAQKKGWLI